MVRTRLIVPKTSGGRNVEVKRVPREGRIKKAKVAKVAKVTEAPTGAGGSSPAYLRFLGTVTRTVVAAIKIPSYLVGKSVAVIEGVTTLIKKVLSLPEYLAAGLEAGLGLESRPVLLRAPCAISLALGELISFPVHYLWQLSRILNETTELATSLVCFPVCLMELVEDVVSHIIGKDLYESRCRWSFVIHVLLCSVLFGINLVL